MSKELLRSIVVNNPEMQDLMNNPSWSSFPDELQARLDKLDKSFNASTKYSLVGSARSSLYSMLLKKGLDSEHATKIVDECIEEYCSALKSNKTAMPIGYRSATKSNSPLPSVDEKEKYANDYFHQRQYKTLLANIDEYEQRSRTEGYTGKIIMPGPDDIDNIELAKFFARSAVTPKPEIFKEIGLGYAYDVKHTTMWFAGQVGISTIAYEHKIQNRSARRTYNHYRNPNALLWIAAYMGETEDVLRKAIEARRKAHDPSKGKNQNLSSESAAIRKVIPFDRILELWRSIQKAAQEKGLGTKLDNEIISTSV